MLFVTCYSLLEFDYRYTGRGHPMRKFGCPRFHIRLDGIMGNTENQSLYDLLDDNQKNGLNAIKSRIHLFGQGSIDTKTGEQVIEILESWLMDEEQKQHLQANSWDICF